MKNIIFDAESIRAIRDRRKTQTRRVVQPQPHKAWQTPPVEVIGGIWCSNGCVSDLRCPYGRVGDLVWVREKHVLLDREGWDDPYRPKEAMIERDPFARINGVGYTDFENDADSERCRKELGYKWRSSSTMPRWASRLTLELTDVRVQRVQEISEEDAKAEGSFLTTCGCGSVPKSVVGASFRLTWCQTHGEVFPNRWDAINAKRGYPWVSNPWVWAMTFTPIWKNIDQVLAEREAVA